MEVQCQMQQLKKLLKNIPICTTFSPVVMQSKEEIAREYNIPEMENKRTTKNC